MPSIAAHMICAKLVAEELGIYDYEFIRGNLLPDILNCKDSHKKIKGKHYYIPDIEYFKSTLDLKNKLHLGYFTHLLLDSYFLEDYIYDVVNGEEVFLYGTIYQEYDIISKKILDKFEIDINYLNNVLQYQEHEIDEVKYRKNIASLNNPEKEENLRYLDVEDFSRFLIVTSKLISNYIKEVIEE